MKDKVTGFEGDMKEFKQFAFDRGVQCCKVDPEILTEKPKINCRNYLFTKPLVEGILNGSVSPDKFKAEYDTEEEGYNEKGDLEQECPVYANPEFDHLDYHDLKKSVHSKMQEGLNAGQIMKVKKQKK